MHDYDVKVPNFAFCEGREHKTTTFFFFSWISTQSLSFTWAPRDSFVLIICRLSIHNPWINCLKNWVRLQMCVIREERGQWTADWNARVLCIKHSRISTNGYLSTMATFFGEQRIHWLSFKLLLYNGRFFLSPRWQLWRGSTVCKRDKSLIPLTYSPLILINFSWRTNLINV